jgi:hypothetical protein
MEISVQYEMTPKELRRGLMAISPVRQLAVYAIFSLTPVAVGTHWFREVNVGSLVAIALLEPLIWYGLIRGQRKQIGRLSVPTTLTLTTESVTIALPASQVAHQWSAFVGFASDKEFWLFYTNKQCAVIVAKRAFGAEQRAEIEELVQQRTQLVSG